MSIVNDLRVYENLHRDKSFVENNKSGAIHFWIIRTINLTLEDYYERLIKFCGYHDEIEKIARIYLERYVNRGYLVHEKNYHRLMAVSMGIAMKWHQDDHYDFRHICLCVGLDKREYMRMELMFCTLLEWKMYVSKEEYEDDL